MNIIIIDRSDLDGVVGIMPSESGNPPHRRMTRREDLEESLIMTRADIVLLNGRSKQFLLYATAKGFAGDTWILDILDDAQYKEVKAIAKRMRQNAIDFPPAAKLLFR